MPTFPLPAAVDDADANPEAIRLIFELGRMVVAAHILERAAANLWMNLSPVPPVAHLDKRDRFPQWDAIITGLTVTADDQLIGAPILDGVREAIVRAREAQERRNRLIHDLTGIDVDRDPPALIRLEWDSATRRRHEVTEPASAVKDAVDELWWSAKGFVYLTDRLRDLGLLHHDVAAGDWD